MNAIPAADLVEVVVAHGRSLRNAMGETVLAGQTARVPAQDVPRLIADGFVCDPNDALAEDSTRHRAEAARIAGNIGRVVQQHLSAVAFGLRPNQDGGLLRAQHFLRSVEDLRKQGEQLVAALTPASTP